MVARWSGGWGMGRKVKELRSTSWLLQNSHGGVKEWSSQKVYICMTHGQGQLCEEDCLREWGVLGGGEQKGKNWDNCNSINNKI